MIDLLKYKDRLQVSQRGEKKYIFCAVRKKDLVLQPEELVRQLFLHYLMEALNYPIEKIAVEKGLRVNNRLKRFDILIYDRNIAPYILVECKAPFIDVDQDVMDQIGQYNLPLGAEFLVLTNGTKTIVCQLSENKADYQYIESLPSREVKK